MVEENNNNLVWQLHSTDAELAKLLKKALRQVIDPELGMDVIALGLIRDALEKDGEINIKMILTTPFCPYAPELISEVTERAESVIKRTVYVDLGMDPWDKSMLEDGVAAEWGLF